MDHLLIRGWVFILIGALLIGGGGVFTTLGWSRISDRSKMRNLINGVVREWEINDVLRQEIVYSASPTGVDILKYRLYVRLKTTALNNVLASGLFDSSSKEGKAFLKEIAGYEAAIIEVNSRLDLCNRFMTSETVETNLETIRKGREEFVLKSDVFISFFRKHGDIKESLEKNYGWVRNTWGKTPPIPRATDMY